MNSVPSSRTWITRPSFRVQGFRVIVGEGERPSFMIERSIVEPRVWPDFQARQPSQIMVYLPMYGQNSAFVLLSSGWLAHSTRSSTAFCGRYASQITSPYPQAFSLFCTAMRAPAAGVDMITVGFRQPLTVAPRKFSGMAQRAWILIVGSIAVMQLKPVGRVGARQKEQTESASRQKQTPLITIMKQIPTQQQLTHLQNSSTSPTNIQQPSALIIQQQKNKKQKKMLKQPSTNVKMTNVATIRYKINNKNFEIACYRNKALNWRNGVENDVSEVLQTDEIFQNASHGTVAKKADLNKFFPNKTKLEIIEMILQRGELQITDKERDAQQSSILAEIISIIVEKCVHPVTKRRFTHETIKQAVREIHFAVKTDQPAKKQALQCIKVLQTHYKIARGQMRVRIICKKDAIQKIEKQLKHLNIENPQSEQIKGENVSRVYDIEPNKYRELSLLIKDNEDVTIEVVVNVVVNQSTKDLENQQSSVLEPLFRANREEDQVKEEKKVEKQEKGEKKTEQKVLKCSTCEQHAVFYLPADQRAHFKTEWHTENVKRKAKHLPAISEQEYEFNKGYQ